MQARRQTEGPHLLIPVLLLLFPVCGRAAPGGDGAPARESGLNARAAYGYGPFEQAEESRLESIGEYRGSGRIIKLSGQAAQSFREMQAAALRDGVMIIPISGFRDHERQRTLFRGAVKKHGSKRRAARWVAPPGFSHHEAGLAIDLGDESMPKCDGRACFRKTPAYKWLRKNGARFGFELNGARRRPKVKPHEPWHWRYFPAEETDKASAGDDPERSD